MGYEDNVLAVAVTNYSYGIIGVNGKPICSIADVDKNNLVFIAAHDEVAKEMQNIVIKQGIKHSISVYHYLFDIELGEPLKRNVKVGVDELFASLKHGYMPAVYYLTLNDYSHGNVYNGSLYKKMCMGFMTEDTAEKRWERFKKAIDKYLKDGFEQDYNIKICKDYSLIDGLHRLIFAKYFGVDELKADIYDCDGDFYSNSNPGMDVCIREEDLSEYYNTEEIEAIQAASLLLK